MSNNIIPKYMRAKQIAAYFSVSENTVWNYARQKQITPIKVNNSITLFSVEEFEKQILRIAE
ncbi:MAG: helix-turn-helix domain-containing protein [Sulfurimonadaceae bacterium]|jgi:hypothetical protein|nr:helix-turn-helix domain-containing protein [Sulfurimonadaceae bacterium]